MKYKPGQVIEFYNDCGGGKFYVITTGETKVLFLILKNTHPNIEKSGKTDVMTMGCALYRDAKIIKE